MNVIVLIDTSGTGKQIESLQKLRFTFTELACSNITIAHYNMTFFVVVVSKILDVPFNASYLKTIIYCAHESQTFVSVQNSWCKVNTAIAYNMSILCHI